MLVTCAVCFVVVWVLFTFGCFAICFVYWNNVLCLCVRFCSGCVVDWVCLVGALLK